jgi:hypothetical protein
VGIDSGRSWKGILENVKVSTSVYFLHGRVWHNDPDVVYLDKSFTLEQVRAFASFVAVSGQMYMVSEWLPDVPANRLDVVKRTIPNHNLRARPVDLFEAFPARVWHLQAGDGPARRDVVAVFNWGDRPQKVHVDLRRLGLPAGDCAGFEFWENRPVACRGQGLETDLGPRSCRVIALKQIADHPVVVSTSRHVTQGIMDLVSETWDGGAGKLRGVSRVVGGDPYEIRIAVPSDTEVWEPVKTGVSEADARAGVTAETKAPAGDRMYRAVIHAPANREVSWQIECRKRIPGDK